MGSNHGNDESARVPEADPIGRRSLTNHEAILSPLPRACRRAPLEPARELRMPRQYICLKRNNNARDNSRSKQNNPSRIRVDFSTSFSRLNRNSEKSIDPFTPTLPNFSQQRLVGRPAGVVGTAGHWTPAELPVRDRGIGRAESVGGSNGRSSSLAFSHRKVTPNAVIKERPQ